MTAQEKARASRRKYNVSEKGRINMRAYTLMTKYGMTFTSFSRLWTKQEGLCAVCEEPLDTPGSSGKFGPCVDHDHSTKVVRGILCNHCNRGLGLFHDNPALLRAAMEYLDGSS